MPGALSALGSELRANGWELALEVIQEGLADDVVPSLVRLGRVAQFGEMPTFITELGREVERPLPERMRVGGPLAAIARDHARRREALGFAPREVVTEFLLLRRRTASDEDSIDRHGRRSRSPRARAVGSGWFGRR